MSYELTVSCRCQEEHHRVEMERDFLAFIKKELRVASADITNSGHESLLDIAWEGQGDPWDQVRTKLTALAHRYTVCFEIDYLSNSVSTGTQFLGYGAVDAELEYLCERLEEIRPRLMRRTAELATRLGVSARDLECALHVLAPRTQA